MANVFYSWQSETEPPSACRWLIQEALKAAAAELTKDKAIEVEVRIDQGTQDVPGSPSIKETILAKIEAADLFVADVTIAKGSGDRASPNANVLFELGYAVKALGWERVILVQNLAFGDSLPFDLRGHRAARYTSTANASERASTRRELQKVFEEAISEILKIGPARPPPVKLSLTKDYQSATSTGDIHYYQAVATVKNTSQRILTDWSVMLEIPAAVLTPIIHGSLDELRSTPETKVYRAPLEKGRELLPGEEFLLKVDYMVNNQLYRRISRPEQDLYDKIITARAFANGEMVGPITNPLREMHNF